MIRTFRDPGRPTRLRSLLLVAYAVLLGPSCGPDNASPVAVTDADAPGAVPVQPGGPLASVTYVGLPYGPVGLWTLNKLNWGPAPFTGSTNYINADTVILQINAARNKGQRLVLAMTGGSYVDYTTNGQFSMTKWKSAMNTYNKTAIKNAVAAGVADGTIIGNQLIDEPETSRWGTVLTKPMLDQMAAYAKSIFPTLPVGVNHGPPGYKWRSNERYTKVDYVRYLYAWYITSGDVVAWRTAVLAQAKLDGVTPALAVNILNGGVKDKGDGYYDCAGPTQGDLGTRYPNCTMTADQLRSYGKALLPYGCFFMMWQFDKTYMSKTDNQAAFKDLATLAASKPKRSCKRP
jgi:hypothetical protein